MLSIVDDASNFVPTAPTCHVFNGGLSVQEHTVPPGDLSFPPEWLRASGQPTVEFICGEGMGYS